MHVFEIILRKNQNVSQSKLSSIWWKSNQGMSKLCFSHKSISSYRNFSESFQNCVSAKNQLHLIKIIPKYFRIDSVPKLNCILSNKIWDFSDLCLSQNSTAFYWRNSETFPSCFLATIHLDLLPKFLRQFHNVLHPKFNCNVLKLFQDMSQLCLSGKSISSCRKYPKTIWNFVWVEVQLVRMEYVLRISHIGSSYNSLASDWV